MSNNIIHGPTPPPRSEIPSLVGKGGGPPPAENLFILPTWKKIPPPNFYSLPTKSQSPL